MYSAFPRRTSRSSATSTGSTSSSSAVGRPTLGLARRSGARPVGVDITPAQLDTARRVHGRDRDRVPARRGERGGRAAARRLVRPGASRSTVPPSGATRALGAGGRTAAPAGGRLVFLRNSMLAILCVPDEPGTRPSAAASAEGPAPDHLVVRGRRRVPPSATASGSTPPLGGLRGRAPRRALRAGRREDARGLRRPTAEWASKWPAEDLWAARKRA